MARHLQRSTAQIRKAFYTERSGASAVEFAIISPVLIFLAMGMVGFGLYLGTAHSVQQIAADAARASIAGLDAAERENIVSDFITLNTTAYPFLDAEHLTHSVSVNPSDPDQLVVSVRYDASDLPIWNLYQSLPLPLKEIDRSTSIRVGGV